VRAAREILKDEEGRAYIPVLHGCQKRYLGPEDAVRVKWSSLAERSLLNNA